MHDFEPFAKTFFEKTGVECRDLDLIQKALTHDSAGHEKGKTFERLEFLGDACLDFHLARMLFEQTQLSEGEMSQIRSKLARRESLAELLRQWEVENFFILGKSLQKDQLPDSLYADFFESLIGAVASEQGVEVAGECIERLFGPLLDNILHHNTKYTNAKGQLQEVMMSKQHALPKYKLIGRSGPQHRPLFSIELHLENMDIILSKGHTIKEAEMKAAEMALELLAQQDSKS